MDLWNVPSRVATAGLVALAALDVVLVGVALRPAQASGIGRRPVTAAAPSAAAFSSASIGVRPTLKSSVAATRAQAAPLRTMMVAIDSIRAWRVGVGSCATGGATLATTTDGGKTWINVKAPLRSIVRMRPSAGKAAFVIGADASCKAKLHDTSDGGGTWGPVSSVEGAWFREPDSPRTVRAPGSAALQPCAKRAVLDLSVLSNESARVLCVDGMVRQSTDTGASWTDVGKVTGAVSLAVAAADPARTYVARLDAPACAGVQILRVDQRVGTSCVLATIPKGPGQIAMSLVNGGGWLAVGKTTMRSTDDLVTWNIS